jgi:hypothetical protein
MARTQIRQVFVSVAAAVALAICPSCSTEKGQAVGGDAAAATPSSPATSSATDDSSGGLQDIVACDLLTPAERKQIAENLKVIKQGPIGGSSDSCYQQAGNRPEGPVTIGVTIWPELLVENYVTGSSDKVADGEVAGRPAKQVTNSAGTCIVTFAAERGRVDVTVMTKSVKKACDIADRVTEIVASKVPEPTT